MDDYLPKPITLPALRRVLGLAVTEERPPEVEKGPLALLERQRDEAGGDLGGVLEIVDSYLSEWPQVARDLEDALSAGDAEAGRQHAHRLKGLLATLGAESLGPVVLRIERAAAEGDLGGARNGWPELRSGLLAFAGDLGRARANLLLRGST